MTPDPNCFVSVVAPLYNDVEIVQEFVDDVISVLRSHYVNYELVLVDDGSTDDTIEIVRQLLSQREHMRLIRLSRHFGQEIAISAGLDSVIGDFSVVMLPDTDPPSLIPEMVEQSRSGVGVVYGIRRNREREPLLLRAGASFFYWSCQKLLPLKLPKNTTHFRVLNRQAVNAIMQIRDKGRYLSTFSNYVGFEEQGILYDTIQRRTRPRHKSLPEAINLAINIVVANSLYPLRLAAWLGLSLAALNLLYMLFVLVMFLVKESSPEGWSTMSLINSVMFFFVLLILAVVSEYIGRLLGESKRRPLYYVRDEANSSVLVSGEERKNVVTDSVESP